MEEVKMTEYMFNASAPCGQEKKVCCMCEFWGGKRELSFLSGFLRLNGIKVQFYPQPMCMVRKGHMSYHNSGAAYCKTYQRWHMLPTPDKK